VLLSRIGIAYQPAHNLGIRCEEEMLNLELILTIVKTEGFAYFFIERKPLLSS
jgi:hypothetical protein